VVRMTSVYLVWHVRPAEHEDDEDNAKLLGVFSTRALAGARIERARDKPGFRDHPRGFEVSEYVLDRDEWIEGFHVVYPDDLTS
jgi:hypothetical protein